MREATGGALLIYLVIPIIILFIVFIGFIMNYAAAYRAANYVVTQLETCNGNLSTCGHMSDEQLNQNVRQKYHYMNEIRYDCSMKNSKGTVCTVSLDVNFDVPLLGMMTVYTVTAQTKTIYDQ